MDILFVVTTISFFIWAVRNCFYWVWLWHKNEYRFDLTSLYIRERVDGRKILFSFIFFLKLLAIVLFVATVFDETLIIPYHIFVASIFLIDSLKVIKEIGTRTIKLPPVSFRSAFIIIPTICLITLFYFNPLLDIYLWFLLLDRFLIICIIFFIFATFFPSELWDDYQVEKAKKKLLKKDNLLVIVVAGGVGKTITSSLLSYILGTHFRVMLVQTKHNTYIEIAKRINKELREETNIMIVPLDAYQKNDFEKASKLLNPKIVVLTSPPKNKEWLFKDESENIKKYFELIDTMQSGGVVLLDGDSLDIQKTYIQNKRYINKLSKKIKIIWYSGENKRAPTHISNQTICTNVSARKDEILFDVLMQKKKMRFAATSLAKNHIPHILPGIAIAQLLGKENSEIQQSISQVTSPPQYMITTKLTNGAMLIDNSLSSANELLTESLIIYDSYKGMKILVLTPDDMYTKQTKEDYYTFGKRIAQICDILVLTNRNFNKQLVKGFYDSGSGCIIKYGRKRAMVTYISQRLTKKGDIAVFVGKEAGTILHSIQKKSSLIIS